MVWNVMNSRVYWQDCLALNATLNASDILGVKNLVVYEKYWVNLEQIHRGQNLSDAADEKANQLTCAQRWGVVDVVMVVVVMLWL